MPLIRMEASVKIPDGKKPELVAALSEIIARATGKPETYVMAIVAETTIGMAGETGPAAFCDIRSIGSLNKQVNAEISSAVATLLEENLGIPAGRTYLTFTDVNGANWGWNGGTFG